MKRLGLLVAGVLVLAAVVFLFVSSHLDRFVKDFIEKQGSAVTQTEVTLSNVTLHPLDGEGELSNLIIANPTGFSKNFAIEFGTIRMAIDTNSIRGTGPIIINRVEIQKPHINFEIDPANKNNLQTLQQNAGNYASSGNQEAADKAASKGESRKVIIRKLLITESKVGIHHSMLKNDLSADIPTIELHDLGSNKGGLTSAELTQAILNAITNKTLTVSSGKIIKELGPVKAIGNGALGDVGSRIQGIFGN